MAGRSSGVQSRPGWTLEPDLDPIDDQLRRRRWRILRVALPYGHGLDPLPAWVKTPEQFIGWLIGRLTPQALKNYFEDFSKRSPSRPATSNCCGSRVNTSRRADTTPRLSVAFAMASAPRAK